MRRTGYLRSGSGASDSASFGLACWARFRASAASGGPKAAVAAATPRPYIGDLGWRKLHRPWRRSSYSRFGQGARLSDLRQGIAESVSGLKTLRRILSHRHDDHVAQRSEE